MYIYIYLYRYTGLLRLLHCALSVNPRFGRAMATVRTRNMRTVKAAAKEFLEAASKTAHELDRRPKINSHWLKHARLMPVLEFLASAHLKP